MNFSLFLAAQQPIKDVTLLLPPKNHDFVKLRLIKLSISTRPRARTASASVCWTSFTQEIVKRSFTPANCDAGFKEQAAIS
jgi:hypothetical protein